jgi:phosphoserine phosphatase
VYDFDGTLLPMEPWDSEQELLLAWLESRRPPFLAWRRLYGRLVAEADRRGRLPRSFKRHYLRFVRGVPEAFLDRVAERLAGRISPEDRGALQALKSRGHRLLVASCGTADLSERVLAACGVLSCFEKVFSNRFVFQDGLVAGMRLEVPSGTRKRELMESLGIDPTVAVTVGDGATDLPLWEWSGVPVVVDRGGARHTRFGRGSYQVVPSTAGVLDIVTRLGG